MELSKRTKAALWWQQLIKAKSNLINQSLSISNQGQSAKRFLIILPELSEESDLARQFVQTFRNALGPMGVNQMRIIGPANIGNLLDLSDYHDFILFSDKDLNRWKLPGKELIWTCQRIQVDAVLDLNQSFAPVSATLCQTIRAKMKIGFFSDYGDSYYNIMIKRKGEELAVSGFKEIFQILGI